MSADDVVYMLFLMCLPAANLYPIFYLCRPWRTTAQGRALMVKTLGNMIVIDVIVLSILLGDAPWLDMIRVIGMTAFFLGINYLLVSLIFSEGASRYPPWSWFGRHRRRRH